MAALISDFAFYLINLFFCLYSKDTVNMRNKLPKNVDFITLARVFGIPCTKFQI